MIGRAALLRRFFRDSSGHALLETTLALPFLLTAGLWGTELANLELAHMKVAQVAEHLADNASRIGDTSTLVNRKVFEADINDIFRGAGIQSGKSIDFFEHGRAIISSLEVRNGGSGQQFIHWQRCMGKKAASSSYGNTNDNVSGMGPAGNQVTANAGSAVIFVEVIYDYQPLVSSQFASSTVVRSIAAFTVRDNRDLTQIHQRNPHSPDTVAACNVYSGVGSVEV